MYIFNTFRVLQSYVLSLYASWSNTADEIRADFNKIMEDMGFSHELMQKLFIVTDGGSNVTSAFQSSYHLCCMAHLLNLVAKRLLDPYKKDHIVEIELSETVKEELMSTLLAVKVR
jgi:hypothetical protein